MNSPPDTEPPQKPEGQDRREWSERQTVHTPVLPAQNARQGATGHNVRYVLGFGVVGIVIAFAIIYLIYFA